ncbi:7329_t:CDS:2, partial [Acaulospora colombiana]
CNMENPPAFIENALHQHFVGLFKLDLSSPNSHIKPHASQRQLEPTHIDRLYKSFKAGINRMSAPPILAILGDSIQPSLITNPSSPDDFPKEINLFIFSGQHRVKALEKLAQDADQQDNAWWLVKVYNSELERNLPFLFEVLVIKENEQAPDITRGVHSIDLFHICQRLAKEQGQVTLRALKGANYNQKKGKPSSTMDGVNPSTGDSAKVDTVKPVDIVPSFVLGFLTCIDYPIVLEGLEKVMEIPLCRAVLNEVHQIWIRLLADEGNHHIMALKLEGSPTGRKLPSKKPFKTLNKQWNLNTLEIEQGPKGLPYLSQGPSGQPEWVFGDNIPFPSWVSGSGLEEIIRRASRMADAAKCVIGWDVYNVDTDLKQREDFLRSMGDNREKFELDCYRYSDLIKPNTDLKSALTKVERDPHFHQFMECCPLPRAKKWLQINQSLVVNSFERQDIPHILAQDTRAKKDDNSSPYGANPTDQPTTSTKGALGLPEGFDITPIIVNPLKTNSTDPVASFSKERSGGIKERGALETYITKSTHKAALKSIQSRRHHRGSQSDFSLHSDSQSRVSLTELENTLEDCDPQIQFMMFNLVHQMIQLSPTNLRKHLSEVDILGSNRGEHPPIDSNLSRIERKRKRSPEESEEDPTYEE